MDDAAEVYQSDLGDQDYGPWLPTGLSRAAFLGDLTLWNRANGGAAVSVVGAQGKETSACLRALTLASERPDFTVYTHGSSEVAVSPDGDVYVWGPHEHVVRAVAAELRLAWDDLEV